MEDKQLVVFEDDRFGTIRTITDDAGRPWFVAKDVAISLGYIDSTNAIKAHCKGVVKRNLPTAGGKQSINIIPESDLYRLIMNSKLPSAEDFQYWVFEEVLPSIRKINGTDCVCSARGINSKIKAGKMGKELLQILQHSLGVDQYGHGEQYRNHFATGPGGKDFAKCQQLTEMGFMQDLGTMQLCGGMHCFIVTPAGKDYVAIESPTPPKITRSKARYKRFLEYGDSFNSFLDFCRWDAAQGRSWNDV